MEEHIARVIKKAFKDNNVPIPNKCMKVLTRNKRRGQLCGKKVSNETEVYCTIHSGKRPGYEKEPIEDTYTGPAKPVELTETEDGSIVNSDGTPVNFRLVPATM